MLQDHRLGSLRSRPMRLGLTAVFLVGWSAGLAAAPYTQIRSASLYTDLKAHKVGDLLTVLIVESATARNAVSTNTKKSSDFKVEGGPGVGPFDFIGLFGADATLSNQSDNQGQTARAGQLKAQMTVQVVGVRDNGDLVIEGNRVVGINNDKEMLTLTGIVRAEDVGPDNTVYSYQIADAQIGYRGKGASSNAGRPGFITRFLNWLF
ncbi:MAG: flagellar basal body L-ring protein FlgH [Candidatus Zixiibacteriota bacterium]